MTCKKLKYLQISIGQDCILPIETEADSAVAALCAVQAHRQGGVPSRVLGTGENQPGLEREGTQPAKGKGGETEALC